MIKYLITGATGAIGSALVRLLAAEGEEVRAFARDEEKFRQLLPDVSAEVITRVDELLMNSGLPVTVVHLPDFYGPGVVNPLVRPLFENALAARDVKFPGPVDVPHEFIYIDDAARALIAVAGREECFGKRYTVGGVEPITVHRFVELIY